MTVFVTYEGNDEVLVTTGDLEQRMTEEYFGEGTGRYIEEYDRYVSTFGLGAPTAILVTSSLTANK